LYFGFVRKAARITAFPVRVNPEALRISAARYSVRKRNHFGRRDVLSANTPLQEDIMRFIGGLLLIALIIVAGGIAFGFIDFKQVSGGKLPEVAVKQGSLPKYEANVAKIEVGSRNETVEVPTVNVKKP
jgi:hypothetical protein